MADLLTFVVYALATARLTGIINQDEIIKEQRAALIQHINPQNHTKGWRHKLTYLLICPWCASPWIALLITAPAAHWAPHHPATLIPALALAFSQITGMTSTLGRD